MPVPAEHYRITVDSYKVLTFESLCHELVNSPPPLPQHHWRRR